MEENPNNMVEGVPAGTKKRSGSSILPLVIAVLVCAALAGAIMLMRGGCSNSATHKLKMTVTEANKECPLDYGNGLTLQSVEYDENSNVVTMVIADNDENIDMDYLKANAEAAKKHVYLTFLQDDSKAMVNDIANGGAGFKVVFKDMKGGKTVDVQLSAEEVKEVSKSKMSQTEIDKMQFENWLSMQQKSCPQDIGDGTAITKVVTEGGNVVLYINGTDNETLDYIRDDSDYYNIVKNGMMSVLADDGVSQSQFKLLASNGFGLVYRLYNDDPKKCVDITFSVDELQKALPGKAARSAQRFYEGVE